jgi:FMN reductase
VRGADALVFGSPGYHGTLSGLVKNALDYLEELGRDARPYVDGLPSPAS